MGWTRKTNWEKYRAMQIRRQDTGWRWTQTWKRQLIPWYTSQGPDVPEVAKLKAQERYVRFTTVSNSNLLVMKIAILQDCCRCGLSFKEDRELNQVYCTCSCECRLDLDWQHSRHHYKKNRETIEKLRAFHRSVKEIVKPTIKPIDYHVPYVIHILNEIVFLIFLFSDHVLRLSTPWLSSGICCDFRQGRER